MNLEEANLLACSKGWLSQQGEDFQKALSVRTKLKSVDKGKLVYHIEDTGPEMFCLVSGCVAITVAHPTIGTVAAHIMHPGDWFGEAATLSRSSRLVTVHSRTACQFISLGRSAVDEVMKIDPGFAYCFFDLMRRNSEISLRSGIDLLIQAPRARLCARLLTLGGARGNVLPPFPYAIPMTQEELALTSCLSRKTVHQVLNALVQQGVCALHYREIEVLDARALAGIVMASAKDPAPIA